jgi:hypothetical protein
MKLIKNKRGVELTINFIVMLILGMAMLTGAIMLSTKLFGKVAKHQASVDAQTQQQIKNLITSGNDLVVIYPQRMEVSRKDSVVFGVGVQNTLTTQGPQDEFSLFIEFDNAMDPERQKLCDNTNTSLCSDPLDWVALGARNNVQKIDKNDLKSFPVPVVIPKGAKPGIYVFNVGVCEGGTCNQGDPLYGDTLRKIYVRVE